MALAGLPGCGQHGPLYDLIVRAIRGESARTSPPPLLAFAVEPADSVAGLPIAPAVEVRTVTPDGALVRSSGLRIDLALRANPGGGLLLGTLSAWTVDGVARFDDLAVDAVGRGYTLGASAPGVAAAASRPFDVRPDRLRIEGIPDPAPTGAPFDVTVAALDGLGRVAPGYTGTIVFTSTDPFSTLPGAYAFTAADLGEHAFPAGVSLASLGTMSVVVTDLDDPRITGSARTTVASSPPGLVSSAGTEITALVGEEVVFTVTATDGDGDPLDVRLLNPPPACIFDPVRGGSSPASSTVRWTVPSFWGGLRQLAFEADDGSGDPPTRLVVWIQVIGSIERSGIVTGDVTGDGIFDVVAGAIYADPAGQIDAGAIYVFDPNLDRPMAPTATLAGAAAFDRLGDSFSSSGQGVQLADVTGDGVLDVVAVASAADIGGVSDAGAIYVWQGGSTLAGTPAPWATLTIPSGSSGDRLGFVGSGQGVLIADVTGDGVNDVVAGASCAAAWAGAVYIWEGGAALAGSPAPRATLAGTNCRQLGFVWSGQGILLGDVTGDGQADLVVGASYAGGGAGGAVYDGGAIFVWAGGPSLVGSAAPARLYDPTAAMYDELGNTHTNQGLYLADVTGDGTLDVLGATAPTPSRASMVFVWAGGTLAPGDIGPTASLTLPDTAGAEPRYSTGIGILTGDVTNDGLLDVVVGSTKSRVGGVEGVGSVCVWAGGRALTGTPAPRATLTGPAAYDWLGEVGSGQGVQLADVTGDGTLDVVAGAMYADAAATDAGAVFVWQGGAALSGNPAATAVLGAATAVTDDALGFVGKGQGIILFDLDGDGTRDVLAASTSRAGYLGADTIFFWAGGAALVGAPPPAARLTATGASQLGYMGSGQGILLADVTGDGRADVVAGALWGPASGPGSTYVWAGGGPLAGTVAPLATMQGGTDSRGDNLQGLLVADLSEDGVLDVLVRSKYADFDRFTDTGALYVWQGGPTLVGAPSPAATLPGVQDYEYLGSTAGQGVQIADATGDGVMDIVAGSMYCDDIYGTVDAGAVYRIVGPIIWSLQPGGDWLTVPGAAPSDYLGY